MAPQAVHALKHKLNGLTTSDEPFHVHPLAQLRSPEIDVARQVVTKARSGCLLLFRDIFTEEPKKAELVPFLSAEHSGQLSDETPRPPRLARVQYDTIGEDGSHAYTESVINIHTREEVVHWIVDKDCQPPLTLLVKQSHHFDHPDRRSSAEFKAFQDACVQSPIWKEAMAQLELPDGFGALHHHG
jgi:primary-amine oxidase